MKRPFPFTSGMSHTIFRLRRQGHFSPSSVFPPPPSQRHHNSIRGGGESNLVRPFPSSPLLPVFFYPLLAAHFRLLGKKEKGGKERMLETLLFFGLGGPYFSPPARNRNGLCQLAALAQERGEGARLAQKIKGLHGNAKGYAL